MVSPTVEDCLTWAMVGYALALINFFLFLCMLGYENWWIAALNLLAAITNAISGELKMREYIAKTFDIS